MTRDRSEQRSAPGTAAPARAPDSSPGKRTGVEAYAAMIAALGVMPAGPPLFQNGAAWEPIQRQDDPVAIVVALGAELDRIGAEAVALRSDLTAADTTQLRALASQLEALRPQIDAVTEMAARTTLQSRLVQTQDQLVLGFQALAAHHADTTLQGWDGASAEDRAAQRTEYVREAGYPGAAAPIRDWCGMFANAQLRAAGFADEFNLAFNHATNLAEFFGYAVTTRSPGLIQPHGTGAEVAVSAYHAERGSMRSWLSGDAIGNDLRAGDVVAVDWQNDGEADHVCIVASYTPGVGTAPGLLVTIDGNAYGARKPGDVAPAFDGAEAGMATFSNDMTTRDVSTSQYARTGADTFDRSAMLPNRGEATMTMRGRGRPSLIDFEIGHVYPGFTGRIARDTDGPSGPIQSPGIARDGEGQVASADPNASFDAATAGAAREIPFRAEMQTRLGADFSSVQAYTGRDLAPLGARAATRGEQVTFAEASPDKEVVAHELTHVLQSRQGRAGTAAVSDPGDASEHEAREVAAAVTTGRPVSVGAAPSAAIHRQDDGATVPTAVHPPVGGNRQDVPIDWSDTDYFVSTTYRLPVNNSTPGSIGEVHNFFLLRHLSRELPDLAAEYGVPGEDVASLPDGRHLRAAAVTGLNALIQTRMTELLEAGDQAGADRIRVRLFAANQHALADTLLIPGSTRHQPIADGDSEDTWCNVYAFDVVTAMGGYLPRQWWTPQALEVFAAGQQPTPDQVVQLDANALYNWMTEWGVTQFGWEAVATATEAQAAADAGSIAIILASTGDPAAPGHVSVVMAQTADRRQPTSAETAGADVPLQSQAGAQNFASNASGVPTPAVGRRAWWSDGQYANLEGSGFGFFVYRADRANRGFGDLAVHTPEEMGTVLPATPATGG